MEILQEILNKDSLTPSLDEIKKNITDKTKALLLYYYSGYIYDNKSYFELFPNIIEDVTSIIGANKKYDNIKLIGKFAVSDFSVKSLITTGEGAGIFCNDKKLYKKLLSLLEIDYSTEYYPRLACLMPDLNAAMGISQDKSLNHRLELREQIGKIYEEAVKKNRSTYLMQEEGAKRIYSDFPIIIKS